MSRRRAKIAEARQDFDQAVETVFPKQVDDPIETTEVWVSDTGKMTREHKIAAMCDIAGRHLYSVQYNQCQCGFRPTDTPPHRQFLEHVMTDIVNGLKL